MKNFIFWIESLISWLVEIKVFWLTLISISTAIYLMYYPELNITAVCNSGLFLQTLGAVLIVWEYIKVDEFFGKPGILDSTIQWFNKFPVYNKKILKYSSILDSYIFKIVPADSSLEDRLKIIEENLEILRNEFIVTYTNFEKMINMEIDKRENNDKNILSKLNVAMTDGLHINSLGVVLWILGTFVSTKPDFIFSLLH